MPSRSERFEALDWLLFSAGGMVAAFLLPVHVLVSLILAPVGVSQAIPPALAGQATAIPPLLVRLYLFLILAGAAWHALHRLRFTLMGLGLAHHRAALKFLFLILQLVILGYAFGLLLLV